MSLPFLQLPFKLPREIYYKPNYRPLFITLDVKPKELSIVGDYFAVLASNADLSKVYVGFNIPPERELTLATVAQGVITPFSKIYLTWEDSETGKFVVAVVGQEAAFLLTREGVVLTQDLVGLAREATLAAIKAKTDNLNFTAEGFLRGSIATSEIMVPVDLQARFKPPGMTLFSGTVTSSGSTADIDVSLYSALEIILKVMAVSGTNPVLNVYIEGRFEATGDYKPLVFQEGITSTGIWYFTINPCVFRYIRVRWLVGGTSPSFTFTVAAQAMV
jgi:hypothetical protein